MSDGTLKRSLLFCFWNSVGNEEGGLTYNFQPKKPESGDGQPESGDVQLDKEKLRAFAKLHKLKKFQQPKNI